MSDVAHGPLVWIGDVCNSRRFQHIEVLVCWCLRRSKGGGGYETKQNSTKIRERRESLVSIAPPYCTTISSLSTGSYNCKNKKSPKSQGIYCSLYPPRTKFRGVYRNHFVCPSVRLSVCPSVCADSCPAHNFFMVCGGLPYLVHGCITMRPCVAYIHDPDTTLNFDLKVKFIGFLTCFRVQPITFLWFDIGLPYLAHGCITIRQCVVYIHDPDSMLTFDLKVKF